jgi:MFS family permease
VFKRVSFSALFVPLYVINALSTALIGAVVYYPAQFALWLPNGASRGLLRVGTMARAMEESEDEQASVTAALIGAGYDAGRIAGPAAGGLIAGAFGLSTMFVVMPLVYLAVLLPLALRARLRSPGNARKP